MTRYIEVAAVTEILSGTGCRFEVEDRAIAVFNNNGNFYAIDDLCPHMGASLAEGHFSDCIVTCPWHAWRFDVRDGTWCDNPRVKTDAFPVKIAGGRILVGIPETTSMDETRSMAPNDESDSAGAKPACEKTANENAVKDGPSLSDFQQLIRNMYFEKDVARGISGTFMWFMEEIGELATALRGNDQENLSEEFADVLAWLATIANVAGVDLAAAVAKKYGAGCPGCGKLVCSCPDAEKP